MPSESEWTPTIAMPPYTPSHPSLDVFRSYSPDYTIYLIGLLLPNFARNISDWKHIRDDSRTYEAYMANGKLLRNIQLNSSQKAFFAYAFNVAHTPGYPKKYRSYAEATKWVPFLPTLEISSAFVPAKSTAVSKYPRHLQRRIKCLRETDDVLTRLQEWEISRLVAEAGSGILGTRVLSLIEKQLEFLETSLEKRKKLEELNSFVHRTVNLEEFGSLVSELVGDYFDSSIKSLSQNRRRNHFFRPRINPREEVSRIVRQTTNQVSVAIARDSNTVGNRLIERFFLAEQQFGYM